MIEVEKRKKRKEINIFLIVERDNSIHVNDSDNVVVDVKSDGQSNSPGSVLVDNEMELRKRVRQIDLPDERT